MTTAFTAGRCITNTSDEVDNRLAIRELIDVYRPFADRREPDEQAALCAEDGRALVCNDPAASEPARVLTGHAEHVERFHVLSQFAATMPSQWLVIGEPPAADRCAEAKKPRPIVLQGSFHDLRHAPPAEGSRWP
jgi:hypothetical protein